MEGTKGLLYDGYLGFFEIDKRLIEEDDETEFFKMRVYADNKVLLTMPALTYSHLSNDDRDSFATHPFISANCLASMDIQRNRHYQDKEGMQADRQWKHLLLVFPNDHVLKASVLWDQAGEDEELPSRLVPDAAGKYHVAFKVARTDKRGDKAGKTESTKKKKSKWAEDLGTGN